MKEIDTAPAGAQDVGALVERVEWLERDVSELKESVTTRMAAMEAAVQSLRDELHLSNRRLAL
jgi:hypothetical protein